MKMTFYKSSSFTKLVLFISRILQKHYKNQKDIQKSFSNGQGQATYPQLKLQSYPSLSERITLEPSQKPTTLIFNVEGTLLKSQSFFPYFMLVAFEAGSLIRAFVLLLSYPFLCLFSDEFSLKVMVMICFMGIKKEGFRVGSCVLPKFFLEDVSVEGFEVLRKSKMKIGVSDLPQVMVESFLRDYLEVGFVVGRNLKVFCGYFMGLMDDNEIHVDDRLKKIFEDEKILENNIIGLDSLTKSLMDHHPCFSHCKVRNSIFFLFYFV